MSENGIPDGRAVNSRLVCIDSDGCAFDVMAIKHQECFCPATILVWGLQPISRYVRQVWDYGNLYSVHRGQSRFLELKMLFDWLEDREEVRRLGFRLPDISSYRKWLETAPVLNNEAVRAEAQKGDPVMQRVLDWSLECNRRIAEMVHDIPPFPGVREALEKLSKHADIAVVSATAREALKREWTEHGLIGTVSYVFGQEDGGKKDLIRMLLPRYSPGNVMMIGDAPGDLSAARLNGVRFYPIRPGEEADSWQEFLDGPLDRFLSGTYTEQTEDSFVRRFSACLPDQVPWKTVKQA